MTKPCAKELILKLFDEQPTIRLDEQGLSRLHALAVAALPDSKISRRYVLSVLAGAGKPVMVKDPFAPAVLAEPYRGELADILKFDTLENAETCLHRLGEKFEQYRALRDGQGVHAVKALALLGKRRAAAAARRVKDPDGRQAKSEIAEWFTLWLYDPGSFFDWLLLRKQSPEYREKFGELDVKNVTGERRMAPESPT